MVITWLSYYTRSLSPITIDTANEKQAFAIYTRWRSMRGLVVRLYDRYRTVYQQRSERHALLALPEYVLKDIGMFSTGTEVLVESVPPLTRRTTGATSRPYKTGRNVHVGVPDVCTVSDELNCEPIYVSSRAA